jgi:hypothetical protein
MDPRGENQKKMICQSYDVVVKFVVVVKLVCLIACTAILKIVNIIVCAVNVKKKTDLRIIIIRRRAHDFSLLTPVKLRYWYLYEVPKLQNISLQIRTSSSNMIRPAT